MKSEDERGEREGIINDITKRIQRTHHTHAKNILHSIDDGNMGYISRNEREIKHTHSFIYLTSGDEGGEGGSFIHSSHTGKILSTIEY